MAEETPEEILKKTLKEAPPVIITRVGARPEDVPPGTETLPITVIAGPGVKRPSEVANELAAPEEERARFQRAKERAYLEKQREEKQKRKTT